MGVVGLYGVPLRKYWHQLTKRPILLTFHPQVRQDTLEVEFPLIEGQLDEIDQQLRQALEELNWNSENAWEYIQQTRDQVRDATAHLAELTCRLLNIHAFS